MKDIDVIKLEGMLFQLRVLEDARKLSEKCWGNRDCVGFFRDMYKEIGLLARNSSKMYLSKYRDYAISGDIVRGLLRHHVDGIEVCERIDGNSLYTIGEQFYNVYKNVYRRVEFDVYENRFIQEEESDEDEYDEDFDCEVPGYKLWNYLSEWNCNLYGDLGDIDSLYLYGGFIYEIEVLNENIRESIRVTKDMQQERLFVLYYIERLIYHAYGLYVIAIAECEDKLKIIGLRSDGWYSKEHFVGLKFRVVPELILMKKYIKEHILKNAIYK